MKYSCAGYGSQPVSTVWLVSYYPQATPFTEVVRCGTTQQLSGELMPLYRAEVYVRPV
jgi:hypothetical protein